MRFHIVTPSFNQLGFLKRCVVSVRDQVAPEAQQSEGSGQSSADSFMPMVESSIIVHHHVQDACSNDGTMEFLKEFQLEADRLSSEVGPDGENDPKTVSPRPKTALSGYSFSSASEPDNGMYDAINKGIAFAGTRHQAVGSREPNNQQPSTINFSNHLVAWLNCDEQYLPGTLEFVAEYFDHHPDVDILFGDYLIVDEGGALLSFRKGGTPRLWYIQASHLNNLSCAMFFRAGVFQALEGFDATYKAVADEDFIVRALKAGFKAGHVSRYFSVFTYTGNNLGGGDVGREEFASLKKETPFLLKLFRIPLNLSRWIEKWLGGTYYQRFPLSYSIYTDGKSERKMLSAKHSSWRWPAPNA